MHSLVKPYVASYPIWFLNGSKLKLGKYLMGVKKC